MANSYGSNTFTLDTDVDYDGLVTLKGGAPASTDTFVISGAMTLTITDNNLDCLKFTVNAELTFKFQVTGADDKTFTMYDTSTTSRGIDGTSSNAFWEFTSVGSSGGIAIVKSNSAQVCGWQATAAARHGKEFYGCKLDGLYSVRASSLFATGQEVKYNDVHCYACAAPVSLSGTVTALTEFENVHFDSCQYSIYEAAGTVFDFGPLFKNKTLKCTHGGTNTTANLLQIYPCGTGFTPRYLSLELSDEDIVDAYEPVIVGVGGRMAVDKRGRTYQII